MEYKMEAAWTFLCLIVGYLAAPAEYTFNDSYDAVDSFNEIHSYKEIDSYDHIGNNEERSLPLCIVPEHPKHGRYWSAGSKILYSGTAQQHLYLNTSCDVGYKPAGGARGVFVCYDGNWSTNQFPLCVRYCKLEPSTSVEYRCIITDYPNSEGTRGCLASEPEGTVIQPRCRQPHYYSVTELPNMVCESGKWNYIPRCERECGRLPTGGVPLIVGGRELEYGYVPWAAGVYYLDGGQWKQVGSAIVISRHVALTAAHVLRLDGERQYLAIAAGKRHRQWQHPLDESREQNSMVNSMHLPENFYGADLFYQEDFAVLVLHTPLEYTPYVGPICINFNPVFVARQLRHGNMGMMAGWGETSELRGSEADVLQILEIPFVSFKECVKRTSRYFRNYLVGGKICAGFANGTAPSRGDSGAGLTFPSETLGITRYYLQAITSTSPISRNGRIDLYAPTSFEPTAKHDKLIKEHWDPYL